MSTLATAALIAGTLTAHAVSPLAPQHGPPPDWHTPYIPMVDKFEKYAFDTKNCPAVQPLVSKWDFVNGTPTEVVEDTWDALEDCWVKFLPRS
jgi:hypothetical protein